MQAVTRQVEHARPAGEVVRGPAGRFGNQRVGRVGGAQHRAHLAQRVVRVDLVDVEHGQDGALLVGEGDLAGRAPQGVGAHRHGERYGKHRAVAQAHLAEHGLVVVAPHEAVERREGADGQHLKVVLGAQRERDRVELLCSGEQGRPFVVGGHQVHQAAAEGRDQLAVSCCYRHGSTRFGWTREGAPCRRALPRGRFCEFQTMVTGGCARRTWPGSTACTSRTSP